MKIAFISNLDETSLSPSVLFAKELIPRLKHEIILFSDSASPGFPVVNHYTRLPQIDEEVGGFDCVISTFEDIPEFLPTIFAINSLPGVMVAFDGVGERLYLSQPWQFKDLKVFPLNQQVFGSPAVVAFTSTHAMNAVSRSGLSLTTAIPIAMPKVNASQGKGVIGYAARYPREEWAEALFDSAVALNLKIKWVVPKRFVEVAIGFVKLYCERRDLSDICTVVGASSFEEEIAELSTCDAFFYGKHDLRRSPPTALFHALALGIPTVVVDFGSAAEIPDWAVVKIPVSRGISASITTALKSLVENHELRRLLFAKGRAYIELVHAPSAVCSDMEAIFIHYDTELRGRLISRRIEMLRKTQDLCESL